MRVLVTGATSLLGRVTVEQLVDAGHQVIAFQRRAGDFASEVAQQLGSIESRADLAAVCTGHDAVIHLAARVGVVGRREQFVATNVDGTQNVLDVARNAGVHRFVHVSSPSVAHAGEPLVGVGAAPADPARTHGHYSTTKAVAERLALDADAPDFAVVAIRPHLVWGPGDTKLIGRIVDRARRGRLALPGSGLALIDTTYVDNAAASLVAALDRAPAVHGQALVVSNAQPRPIAELLARIVAAAGIDTPVRPVPLGAALVAGGAIERVWERTEREDDPPITSFVAEQLATAHWFEQRHTQRALGWAPRVSLEEGFARLTRWYDTPRF